MCLLDFYTMIENSREKNFISSLGDLLCFFFFLYFSVLFELILWRIESFSGRDIVSVDWMLRQRYFSHGWFDRNFRFSNGVYLSLYEVVSRDNFVKDFISSWIKYVTTLNFIVCKVGYASIENLVDARESYLWIFVSTSWCKIARQWDITQRKLNNSTIMEISIALSRPLVVISKRNLSKLFCNEFLNLIYFVLGSKYYTT